MSGLSTLTLQNVSLTHTVGGSFVTTLVLQGSTTFTRQVSGTVRADEVTGAVELADLTVMGDPLLGDQLVVDRRKNLRDIGDFAFVGLSFTFDDLDQGTLSGGQVEFDISLGSYRVHSPSPIDLVGESAAVTNQISMPFVIPNGDELTLQIPFYFRFEDIEVVHDGFATFEVTGVITATSVPEPSTGLLMSLGLVGIALRGRAGRNASLCND